MEAKYIIEYSDFPGQKVLSKINKNENGARYPSHNRIILPYINGKHVEGSFAGRERGVFAHNGESAN